MNGQQTITWPTTPARRPTDPDTSRTPTQPRLSAGRLLALDALARHSAGLTDFELAEITGKPQTSIGKRRGELVAAGLVVATLERRPSPTGSPAIVWRITPLGVATWMNLNQ